MLTKQASSVVQEILKSPNITSSQLAAQSELSKRQISYAISKINEDLESFAIPTIQRDKRGYFYLNDATRQWLTKQIGSMDSALPDQNIVAANFYDESTRQNILIIMLVAHTQDTHLEQLQDKLLVSKNTVLNDLKKLGAYFVNKKISLNHSRISGYYLGGDEKLILELLIETIDKEHKVANGEHILNQINGFHREKVVHLISSIESVLNIKYSDSAFNYLIQALRFSLSRMQNTQRHAGYFQGQVAETKEFKYLKSALINQAIHLKITDDLNWITLLFLTANTLRNASADKDNELILAIDQMIAIFEDKTYITIQNKKEFSRRLLGHLRPVVFRTKYNLPLTGFDFSSVIHNESENRLLMQNIKESIEPVERLIGKRIPTDEMQLIAFYFGAELATYNYGGAGNKKRAIVVCSNGLVVAKLMIDNLKRIFPEINFVTAAAAREFNVYQSDYDLVFTTVPLKTSIPQYIIEPVLSTSEQLKLRLWVLRDLGIQDIDFEVNNVVKIVQRYGTIHEKSGLQRELTKYFANIPYNTDQHENSKGRLPPLTTYVKPQYIQIVDQHLSWEAATRMACQPLIDNKIVESRYIDHIIDQMKDPQNYSYLQGKIAIPHALPEMGSLGDGFGFLIAQQYIDFPGHDHIIIIVPISITRTNLHLRAVNQLVELASNDDLLRKIQRTGSVKYVHQLLSNL